MTQKEKIPQSDFEEALESLCDNLINQIEPLYHSELQPFTAFAGFIKDSLKSKMRTFRESFIQGYQLVLENISVKNLPLEEEEKYQIPLDLWEKLSQNGELLKKEQTLQHLLGYSGEMMAEIYSLAKQFNQRGEWDRSTQLFTFLATLNPYGGWYWQGLGNIFQQQKLYEDALYAYAIGLNCIPYEVESYCKIVRCHLERKNYSEALHILEYGLTVVETSQIKEQLKDLEHGLKAMMAYIQKVKRENHG